jgi:hypothetical protein
MGSNERGSALVEVLVAAGILLLIGTSIMSLYILYVQASFESTLKVQATFLAEEALERLDFWRGDSWDTTFWGVATSTSLQVTESGGVVSVTSGTETVGNFERSFVLQDVYRDGVENIAEGAAVLPQNYIDQNISAGVHSDTVESASQVVLSSELAGSFSEEMTQSIPLGIGAGFLEVADIDNDGDLDIVPWSQYSSGVFSWYENDGSPTDGSWTAHAIDSSANPSSPVTMKLVDIDSDGDSDVIFASNASPNITIYENDGTPASGEWSVSGISEASSGSSPVMLDAGDIDNDGDVDVLLLTTGPLVWYENDGTPFDSGWSEHTILLSVNAKKAHLADLNNDNFPDVVLENTGASKVEWYKNDGSPETGSWQVYTVKVGVPISGSDGHLDVADVNNDGNIDVIYSVPLGGQWNQWQSRWVRNNGDPENEGSQWGLEDQFTLGNGTYFVFDFADIDQDGDIDAYAGSRYGGDHYFLENTGGNSAPSFTLETVKNEGFGSWIPAVKAADIIPGGSLELVSIDSVGSPTLELHAPGLSYVTDGIFISAPISIGEHSGFQSISWTEVLPTDTDVEIDLRSASTEAGLSSASWTGVSGVGSVFTTSTGETIHTSHGTDPFVQYRATLSTTDTTTTPAVSGVTIEVLQEQVSGIFDPNGRKAVVTVSWSGRKGTTSVSFGKYFFDID